MSKRDAIEDIDLGPCCICRKQGRGVRNIIMLEQKAPTPGKGWACLQCGLPPDGAVAVLCDRCLDAHTLGAEILDACRGTPGKDGRIPIGELQGLHMHDMSKHPEEAGVQRCRVCGCTDDDCSGCIERTGEPCYWVEEDLCSACATINQEA